MAEGTGGGKKGRKIGRNKRKYGTKTCEHKFGDSKEHRGCGPLGYYLRHMKAQEDRNYAPWAAGSSWTGYRVFPTRIGDM